MNSYSVKRHYFLWARQDCDWCVQAIGLLNKEHLSYSVFGMDEEPELLEAAKKNFKWETIPIIFEICMDGTTKLIGGFTDLEQHLEERKENDLVYISSNQTE